MGEVFANRNVRGEEAMSQSKANIDTGQSTHYATYTHSLYIKRQYLGDKIK